MGEFDQDLVLIKNQAEMHSEFYWRSGINRLADS
jgi:hypothetical protein